VTRWPVSVVVIVAALAGPTLVARGTDGPARTLTMTVQVLRAGAVPEVESALRAARTDAHQPRLVLLGVEGGPAVVVTLRSGETPPAPPVDAAFVASTRVLPLVGHAPIDLPGLAAAPLVEVRTSHVAAGQMRRHLAAHARIMLAQRIYDEVAVQYWQQRDGAGGGVSVVLRPRWNETLPGEWLAATVAVFGDDGGAAVLDAWEQTITSSEVLVLRPRPDLSVMPE
jgi:hypothetical protein